MVTSQLTATTFLDGYLRDAAEEGWQVTLICSDGPGVAELAVASGVEFAPLPMAREPDPPRDLLAVFRAWRLLRRIRPDVVVYATPKASLVGALAGTLARVPRRVYELWGLRLETATGMSRTVFALLERLTARLSTSVVANSRSLAERARELRVDGGRPVRVLGAGSSHGVDAGFFDPAAEIEPIGGSLGSVLAAESLPVIGFIGRMHPDKGIGTLLEALESYVDQGGRSRLILVGGDEGAVDQAAVARLAAKMPVHLVGHTDDVRPLLAVMDVLVLPSRREGFPNVVLEAAAMQVPAIVSDATGCRDAVVDGVTGIIVPVGDARRLADAVERLLGDLSLRARMGEAARVRVLSDFRAADVRGAHLRNWMQVPPSSEART